MRHLEESFILQLIISDIIILSWHTITPDSCAGTNKVHSVAIVYLAGLCKHFRATAL